MSDIYFRELLGIKPEATREEIKSAYHRLARENHPDFYKGEGKELQELKMMALNEAYAYLMSFDSSKGLKSERPVSAPVAEEAAPAQNMIGLHKDPGYAYYKQGFVQFSRALHGIEALYRISRKKKMSFKPDRYAYERFGRSLVLLRRAHEYFSRVVDEYSGSIWRRDAKIKLERIERFSELYRKILANLKAS